MKIKDLFNEKNDLNWEKIENIPSFSKMKDTKQSRKWHAEGNCFNHTKLVCMMMNTLLINKYGEDCKNSFDYQFMMACALCHDLGKIETTYFSEEDGDYKSPHHGIVGERITRKLFLDEDIVIREQLCYVVRHHMILHHIDLNNKKSDKKLIKMSYGLVKMDKMILLAQADSYGSFRQPTPSITECMNEKEKQYDDIRVRCQELGILSHRNKNSKYNKYILNNIKLSEEQKNVIIKDETDIECLFGKSGLRPTCYILSGFPGSGKSTFIKNIFNHENMVVISRDIIRCELGINGANLENQKKVLGTQKEEDKVTKIFNERIIECCEKNETFILDNTNLKEKYRLGYLELFKQYNPIVCTIWVESPKFDVDCVERRKGEIDESVFERMFKTYQFPQAYETDMLFCYKQEIDDDGKISGKFKLLGFDC